MTNSYTFSDNNNNNNWWHIWHVLTYGPQIRRHTWHRIKWFEKNYLSCWCFLEHISHEYCSRILMSVPNSASPIWDYLQTGGPYWLGEAPPSMITSPREVLIWMNIWEYYLISNSPSANNLSAAIKCRNFPVTKYGSGWGMFAWFEDFADRRKQQCRHF